MMYLSLLSRLDLGKELFQYAAQGSEIQMQKEMMMMMMMMMMVMMMKSLLLETKPEPGTEVWTPMIWSSFQSWSSRAQQLVWMS